MAKRAVRKKTTKAITKRAIKKVMGSEPKLPENASMSQVATLLNWYRNFYEQEDSKRFTLDHLKANGRADLAKTLAKVDAKMFTNLGWCFRIIDNGGDLGEATPAVWARTEALVEHAVEDPSVPRPNVTKRVANRAGNVIADLEDAVDAFLLGYFAVADFDAADFMRSMNVSAPVAAKIVNYYNPLYLEIQSAMAGQDPEIVEYYNGWKKTRLKDYLAFVRGIVAAAQGRMEVVRRTVIRKPRARKEKTPAQLTAKVQILKEDTSLNVKSEDPASIIGANQVWLYNVKYRTLSVLNSIATTGLTVKGTTIQGFDPASSVTKRLRKPEVVVPNVTSAGKVALRKLMDSIKTKESPAKGRLGNDTILLRILK